MASASEVILCKCGCGQPAPIAKSTYPRKGHVKGQPVRFVSGHNTRGTTRSQETRARMAAYAANRPREHHEKLVAAAQDRPLGDALSSTIHAWLSRHYPKTGLCEECGARRKTDYAFTRHPDPHTRVRSDYRELCRSCHVKFDFENGSRARQARSVAA